MERLTSTTKKYKALILLCAVSTLSLAACSAVNSPLLTTAISGTYVAGEGMEQLILSVDVHKKVFYFADQKNRLYLKGRFEDQGNGQYLISCEGSENADVIPEQIITCTSTTIQVMIRDDRLLFSKIHQNLLFVSGKYHYS